MRCMTTKTETRDFSDYTTYISVDPEFYGTDCDEVMVQTIYENLSKMIEAEFTGICVLPFRDGEGSGKTVGPCDEIVNEINEWISDNWTQSL